MYHAFISYHSADIEIARHLCGQLVSAGIPRKSIWFDEDRLRPGCDWHARIKEGCEQSHVVLPVLTPRWKTSSWTRYETYCHDRVIPLVFEGTFISNNRDGDVDWNLSVATPPLTRFQALAMQTGEAGSWSRLIDALHEELRQPGSIRGESRVDVAIGSNKWFVGREREMVAIHEALHQQPTAALTQGGVQAVFALGGVGKTTLVRQYIEVFWRCYPQICWVDCRKGIEKEYARLLQDLDQDHAQRLGQTPERAAAAYRALRDGPARLLVLDNAEDEQSVSAWIPRGGECRTLITSRYAIWPSNVTKLEMFEFTPDHSRAFLIRRTGRNPSTADEGVACDQLAQALGHLPLALEQAGAYMAHNKSYTFRSYLDYYQEAREELLESGALRTTDYPDSVATTWKMTIAKLSAPARAVLRMASYFADTPIPLGLFRADTAGIRELAKLFGDATGGPASTHDRFFVDALAGELHCYSMARQRGDSLQVHNLVQVVERIRLDHETQAVSCQAAQEAFVKYMPDESAESPRTWPIWDDLLPHAERLHAIYMSDDCPVRRPRFDVMHGLSACYFGKGMHAMAGAKARDRCELIRRLGEERSTYMADALLCYGESLRVLGQNEQAIATFKYSLHIRDEIDGHDHERVADVLNYLAIAIDSSDAEARIEAEGYFRRALAIYRAQKERVDHSALMKCLNNFAGLLGAMGKQDEAIPLLQEACQLSADPNDKTVKPQTAVIVRIVLANFYADRGDSRAQSLYLEAFERLSHFPSDHPLRDRFVDWYSRFKRNRHELAEAKRIVSGAGPSQSSADPTRRIKRDVRPKLRVCECVVSFPEALQSLDPVVEARFGASFGQGYTGTKLHGLILTDGESLKFDYVLDRKKPGGDVVGLQEAQSLIDDLLTAVVVKEDQIWASEQQCSSGLRGTHLGCVLVEQANVLKQAVMYLLRRSSALLDIRVDLGSQIEVWISPNISNVYTETLERVIGVASSSNSPCAYVIEVEFAIYWEIRGFDSEVPQQRLASLIESHLVPVLTGWVNETEPFFALQCVSHSMALAIWVKEEFSSHPVFYECVSSGKAGRLIGSEDNRPSPLMLAATAVEINNEALNLRRAGNFAEAAALLRQAIEIETANLSPSSPKHAHRQNNLAIVLLLADRLDESAEANARAWMLKSSVCTGGHDMTSARIIFARLVLDWLTGADASLHLGHLRTLLNRPELIALGGIDQTWDAKDILDRLARRLDAERIEFLRILVDVFNRQREATALDVWLFWAEQELVPLETKWPA